MKADPENEQLLTALNRFPDRSIKILTRDKPLLERYPNKAISPEQYLNFIDSQTNVPFIDLKKQQDAIRPALEHNIHSLLHHGQYIMGPEINELETGLGEYLGAKHTITCSSGTDALLLALMAYGIGPGDAVLTSPFTFFATAEVITLLGATPVFVDIDPDSFNIDPEKLEPAVQAVQGKDSSCHPLPAFCWPAITDHRPLTPKGIIAVDLFGLPCDYGRINKIAQKHGLFVIEDAAQSLGAEYQGRKAGALADIGCSSFFPAKPLGCYGDGGAVFTDDDRLAESMRSIRVHGQGDDKYDNDRIGLNARMDSIQAAVLLAKLDLFPQEIELRQQAAQRYAELLAPCSMLSAPCVPQGYKSAFAQYSVLARDSTARQRHQTRLKEQGIPSVVYYPKPLHRQSAFAFLGYNDSDFPVSDNIASRIFSLPMHAYLSRETQETICQCLLAVDSNF
ncbi:MAG: DegT/DnrJ/EryC1/StrS family aminotransferase [Desulfohalobiaceae bacterium]|nr:DegT/DnrJ/EryC1/StrS family aminotransferase [Desulfohalobiaceae bacterium]